MQSKTAIDTIMMATASLFFLFAVSTVSAETIKYDVWFSGEDIATVWGSDSIQPGSAVYASMTCFDVDAITYSVINPSAGQNIGDLKQAMMFVSNPRPRAECDLDYVPPTAP